MLNMQNVKDIEITEGDVRTIHDKDSRLIWSRLAYDTKYAGDTTQNGTPTPDTPIPVQVVTGEQTVEVSDGVISHNYPISLNIGNMAPISGFQLGGMNSGVPSSGNKYQINNGNNPIKVNPNTQYTISVNLGETVKGVRVGIHSCDADLNFLNDSGWKQIVPTPYTFTTGANVEYVKLIFSLSTTSSTVNTTTQDTTIYGTVGEWLRGCSLKMNEGSSAILDIELCKIGTYQDYIYNSGDDWYVHKTLGKYIFDGSETIAYNASNHGFTITPTNLANYLTNLANPPLNGVCTHFKVNTTTSTWVSDNTIGLSSAGTFWCKATSFATSQQDCTTWLTNNTPTIYYGLATPTDTKITDATLISQLNDVHEWLTRYGYNTTVSGNLPIIINQTNL